MGGSKCVKSTTEVFDKKQKNDLVHTMQEWYESQSTLAKQGLHASEVTGLMNVISDIKTFDDVELVKKMVHAVTEIYMDSWNDSSMDKYLDILKSVKEELKISVMKMLQPGSWNCHSLVKMVRR